MSPEGIAWGCCRSGLGVPCLYNRVGVVGVVASATAVGVLMCVEACFGVLALVGYVGLKGGVS